MKIVKYLSFLMYLTISLYGQDATKLELPPNPDSLKSHWWKYYRVEPKLLHERIILTEEQFKALELTSDFARSSEVQTLKDEFLSNLNTYYNLNTQIIAFAPEKQEIKNSYTFDEWVTNVRNLREANLTLKDYENEIAYDEKTIHKTESGVNDTFVKYLEFRGTPSEKFTLGLQIMVRRSNLENDKQHLAIFKAQKKSKKERFNAIQAEVLLSGKSIDYSSISLEALDTQIQQMEQRINEIKINQLNIKSQFQKYADVQELTNSKRDLLEQELTYQKVLGADAEIQLINLLLTKEVTLLGRDKLPEDIDPLQHRIEQWENKTIEIGDNLSIWSKSTQKELARHLASQNSTGDSRELIEIAKETIIAIQQLQNELYLSSELAILTKDVLKEKHGGLWYFIDYHWDNSLAAIKRSFSLFEVTLFTIGDTPVNTYGIFRFFILIILFYSLARFFQFVVKFIGRKQKKGHEPAFFALGRILFYVIFLFGFIFAISSIGIDLTAFAFIAGILAVGLGFGLQTIFHNFISGILILLEKNIRLGDYVELESGEKGVVKSIKVRSILMTNYDGIDVLVPNSEFTSKQFVNWTLTEPSRRLRLPFGVAYGTDKEFLKEVLIKAVKEVPMTLDEPNKFPQLWLMKFGSSSLDFEMVIWVNEYIKMHKRDMATHAYYMWLIHTTIIENGIKIPFPQRDVHFFNETKI